MLMLHIYDSHVAVKNSNIKTNLMIKDAVKAHPQGYRYHPKYKQGVWDGYISLYRYGRFPSGLLSLVTAELANKHIEFGLVDERQPTVVYGDVHVAGYDLRDYQIEAVDAALASMQGCLHMATNAGKTLVLASLIQATGNKAVIVVPTRALLTQTADKFSEMLQVPIGQYGSGNHNKLDVTVVTMASLKRLISNEDLSDNVLVAIDECHHSRSNTIFDNIFNIPGTYRIGVSGTPLTYDDLSDLKLVGATGPIIYQVTNSDLIGAGWSVEPVVSFITVDGSHGKLDYDAAYREYIVDNSDRNSKIGQVCEKEAGRGPVMVLANWIEHVNAIMGEMPTQLIVVSATGNDSTADIAAKLDELRNGQIQVLVATDIFGEGVDVPALSTVVLAGGGKSHIKLLQRVGRGLRTAKNKGELHVYDFIDDTNDYLLEHSYDRYKLYKSEGFKIKEA